MGVRSVAQGDWAWTEGDTTNKHRPATADPAAALADTADQAGSVAAELTEQAKAQPPAKAPRAQGPRHQAGPGQNPREGPGREAPGYSGAWAGPRPQTPPSPRSKSGSSPPRQSPPPRSSAPPPSRGCPPTSPARRSRSGWPTCRTAASGRPRCPAPPPASSPPRKGPGHPHGGRALSPARSQGGEHRGAPPGHVRRHRGIPSVPPGASRSSAGPVPALGSARTARVPSAAWAHDREGQLGDVWGSCRPVVQSAHQVPPNLGRLPH